jgi:hypothetical protein
MDDGLPTKEEMFAKVWEWANISPEQSRGKLKSQIESCELAWKTFAFEPALQRLREIAEIDPARTNGHQRGQIAAQKALLRILNAIKVDKSDVQ